MINFDCRSPLKSNDTLDKNEKITLFSNKLIGILKITESSRLQLIYYIKIVVVDIFIYFFKSLIEYFLKIKYFYKIN